MCGIFAICCPQPVNGTHIDLQTARAMSSLQKHRGPDYNDAYQHPLNGNTLCHERLAIMDLSCTQPIQGSRPDHQVIHNGEIYNHKQLRESILRDYPLHTSCDSEVIIFLWEALDGDAARLCNTLLGVFSFALIAGERFLVARDPIGVKPLYYGRDCQKRWLFSEMKVIEGACGSIELAAFPPGHYFEPSCGLVRYYQPAWFDASNALNGLDFTLLRDALIAATHRRLMSDAPIGVLLSGGLDSSLISSIAWREMNRLGHPLRSFSIGLDENAPDLQAARRVAAFLGTDHHEFHFTIQEGLAILEDLVYHLETYDITSIRASTPMYFLSRKIRELGVKVVLSGEGADEIFGGYLYFHNAPGDREFQQETIRRVQLLSTADCLRADKSCMANAVEVRVPFLDRDFLDVAMQLEPKFKRPHMHQGRMVEKWVLRKAFDDPDAPYLPPDILWRQKEQFSDGVGYGWIDQLIAHCSLHVSDTEFASAGQRFPHNTPHSKEAYYMRALFARHFPSANAAATVLKWIPKWQANIDPSGRACQVHNNSLASEKVPDGKEENGIKENGHEIPTKNGCVSPRANKGAHATMELPSEIQLQIA